MSLYERYKENIIIIHNPYLDLIFRHHNDIYIQFILIYCLLSLNNLPLHVTSLLPYIHVSWVRPLVFIIILPLPNKISSNLIVTMSDMLSWLATMPCFIYIFLCCKCGSWYSKMESDPRYDYDPFVTGRTVKY